MQESEPPWQEVCPEDEVCCYPPKNTSLAPSDDRNKPPKPRPQTNTDPSGGPIEAPLPEASPTEVVIPQQPEKAGCGFRRHIANKKRRNPLDPRIAGVENQPHQKNQRRLTLKRAVFADEVPHTPPVATRAASETINRTSGVPMRVTHSNLNP
ncbi:hypothetical protein AAG570_005533 [Ranatra chinensis]|uniref:Uncharacterized protein n=1 Tax=Ranatra chinensis TaxID=642074 RepID=A0ABD0YCP8_9HEMI